MSEPEGTGLLAEWEKEAGMEPAQAEPEVLAAEDPAPAPEKPRFSLDDVILDDPRLPESLRGKPAASLFEDRTNGWQQAHHAGFERNTFKTQAETYQKALEVAAAKMGASPTPVAPAPPPSDPNVVYSDPNAFVELIDGRNAPKFTKVEEHSRQLEERLKQVEQERAEERATREAEQATRLNEQRRNAFLSVKPANVSLDDWNEDAGVIASYVIANQLSAEDPRSYAQAVDWLNKRNARITAGTNSTPSAPASAPAPPVGGGKTAPAAAPKPTVKVSGRQRDAFDTVAKAFGTNADTILSEMAADPKYRGAIQ